MKPARRAPVPVYPFPAALYPVLALYAHNVDQLTPDSLLVPAFAALALAAGVLLVTRFLCGGYRRAAIPSALFLFLFFAYGHIHMPFRQWRPAASLVSGALLMALVAAAYVLAVLLVRRRPGARYDTATRVLNLGAALLLVVPVARTLAYEVSAPRVEGGRPGVVSPARGSDSLSPNILHLVPDRYPSESTLAEVYGYDNRSFLDELRARGFYVAEESRCNYGRTDMSLASTLNLDYLDSLLARVERRSRRRVLYRAIQDNDAVRFLRARGYRYLHFGTSWHATSRGRNADANYNRLLLSDFGMMLYRTTMAYPVGALVGFDAHREQWARVRYKFDMLESLDTVPGPVFAFAHFLVPHEPYVLNRDGEFVDRLAQMRQGTRAGFVEQVEYVNRRMLALVDNLLDDDSPRSWVIILQSDEGPHPPENFEHRDSLQTLRAKFRILNAWYLPGGDADLLHPAISPVNTFRVLFNRYFDADMNLLPDRSFFIRGDVWREVTGLVEYRRGEPPRSAVLSQPGLTRIGVSLD
ncbi:MAG TPA: hypothetical protein ENN51_07360 [candidate division WOR-3 bacterium]|uniref:Sulfatase N-terminal domain-containing protein n=1 Tax=candidate division WOR-3 bacterium TaxID=2052148 RepID=A0A7V0T764_UNCW3|nr:hypothetical protein [candidate division WOR-3 bacterium]